MSECERWGASPLVQEKYKGVEACDKGQRIIRIIIIIIIIILLCSKHIYFVPK
jgi:hypothetical protein